MKKLLFLGALAAMLLGTASCSNDMEPAMTDDGTVQFTIELPGNVDSRAISDGLTATELQVAVYKVKDDGTRTLLNDISLLGDKKVTMSNKTATVTFKLVKGLTYKFAFWAQKPGCEAYAFNASTGKVTVDYSKALANVDDGDAFSNTATLTVTGPMTETIYLYRPFAQLNYGDVMEDYAAAVAAGIDFSKTQVTVKQVATEFDIMNQTTSGDNLVDITWPAAASAIGENLKVVDGDETVSYKWLSMCYFLVPNDEATVNTELSLLNTAGTEFNKLNVSNVPVQKNHRTNILGNLFTDDVNFNIIIDERFQQPDNNIVMLSDPDAIAAAAAIPGKYVNVAPGIEVTINLNNVAEGVTINGNGAKLILNQSNNKVNSKNVTIKNFTIVNTQSGTSSISVNAGGFLMKDCAFEPSAGHEFGIYMGKLSEEGVYNYDGVVFDAPRDFRLIGVECKGTINISNSMLKSNGYPISSYYQNGDCDINVSNTQLIGWTSHNTGSNHVYNYENCYFGKLNYGYFRPYGGNGTNVTNMNNCTFSNDYDGVDPIDGMTINANGCKWENGTAIDASLFNIRSGSTIYIDGVLVE